MDMNSILREQLGINILDVDTHLDKDHPTLELGKVGQSQHADD